MMSKLIQIRTCVAVALACLLAASCSDVTDEEPLLDGKYPMTFTANVDGLVVSRTTSENVWSGTEEVAIQIGGKVKKYTAAASGNLSIASGDTPFYWQGTSSISVNAWYPYSATKPADTELTVKADQSRGDAYQASDYLEAVDATVMFGSLASLTFKHRTAKVVVTLEAGEGVDDLTGAVVTFVNQKGVVNNRTEVIPKAGTESSGSTSYTALVIPQQMKGKQFVKVTVGTGNAARDYYYTPTGNSDANLEAGMQYNYIITVKKTGLEVKLTGGSATWGSGTDINGNTTTEIGHHVITITDKNSLSNLEVKAADGTTISAQGDGTYQLPAAATIFSVSYSPSDKTRSLVPTSGLCRLSRSGNTDSGLKYICNYSDVISDVTLALDEYVQMGDFYYSDGTWGAPFTVPANPATNGISPTVIGIVMKAGRDNIGNWRDACRYKLKNTNTDMTTIRGYVLALKDAAKCTWGSTGTSVVYEVNGVDMMNKNDKGFYGYQNTQAIIGYNANKGGTLSTAFPAAYYATTYEDKYAAPANSSGWFLPSSEQCLYWLQNRDALISSMGLAGGDTGWQFSYWSSSEHGSDTKNRAYYVAFSTYNYVAGATKAGKRYVRSCLAF